jgi:error-prone DNA polymerase
MIAAGFTGGQAEELRRAMGFKRSQARMKDIEKNLRAGMDRKGIAPDVQDRIIQSISSFALYGFPESHAASFALIAYASAYLKCHYLAAFTAAMLNNQPMGFYQPATLVKDAQRHGLKIHPVDITRSDWLCTLEKIARGFAMRLGLRSVRGLRQEAAQAIVRERGLRAFSSIDDLKLRVPDLQKSELAMLAEIGALNFISAKKNSHRRDALWQVERVARRAGPLLEAPESDGEVAQELTESALAPNEAPAPGVSPLQKMTAEERLRADFHGTGMTVGPHPMSYYRKHLERLGASCAGDLARLPNGRRVRIAGAVIARQRPGTAKGFVFLSLEDETGISNAIITPQTYEKYQLIVVHQQFLLVEGELQNQENVISVKAEIVQPLSFAQLETASHDFH